MAEFLTFCHNFFSNYLQALCNPDLLMISLLMSEGKKRLLPFQKIVIKNGSNNAKIVDIIQ